MHQHARATGDFFELAAAGVDVGFALQRAVHIGFLGRAVRAVITPLKPQQSICCSAGPQFPKVTR